MIQITVRRFGPICIAATAKDDGTIEMVWAFTEDGASRKLCRS